MSHPPTLNRLRETLTESSPYCSGTLQLPDDSFELFYGKGSPSTFINISKTANSPGSLDALQSASEPAKFGRGDKTVLDESYRKAGKMDTSEFIIAVLHCSKSTF
ncbi:hypothetical protein K466DRAFT_564180 [Polyporus arcularius HHB13444]|uniref:Uncharacterized protein n=1 Tax=Polyporus arcularius HHB13444 TaxID=1314778 RepID=A0A5C3PM27_9APHY|nr:hypothetical protein K466DRAFT_564180 [Polyporus arcularius HHB13444]